MKLNKNSENTKKNDRTFREKKTFYINKIIILYAVLALVLTSLTGCGIIFGSSLGDFVARDDLDEVCSDVQIFENDTGAGNNSSQNTEPSRDPALPPEITEGDGLNLNESDKANSNATDFTNVVAHTKKSVVEINTETVTYSKWSGQYIVEGAGSGVIISRDTEDSSVYYIVTNNHVIEGAENITVILHDGKKYTATLIGTDAVTDVALLAIKEESEELTIATLANPYNELLDGQDIYVIGNPLGELGGSVSKGIISKTARRILISGVKMDLMQIDAAVNPGNSGGGLFDISGNLIGVVNAKYSDEGIEGLGFAIPINTVKSVILELKEKGYISGRPGLGLDLIEKTYAMGSYITATSVVYPTVVSNSQKVSGTYVDSNGETASFDFEVGDIICAVETTEVNSIAALRSSLMDHNIGDTVKITVLRRGSSGRYSEYSVSVVLTEYAPEEIS